MIAGPVIGCGCSCHYSPGVNHFVACCNAPVYRATSSPEAPVSPVEAPKTGEGTVGSIPAKQGPKRPVWEVEMAGLQGKLLEILLSEGWEPFAVSDRRMHLRRQKW